MLLCPALATELFTYLSHLSVLDLPGSGSSGWWGRKVCSYKVTDQCGNAEMCPGAVWVLGWGQIQEEQGGSQEDEGGWRGKGVCSQAQAQTAACVPRKLEAVKWGWSRGYGGERAHCLTQDFLHEQVGEAGV